MLRLSSNITIGNYKFDFCNEIEVNSSWENFTDNAKIVMPKNIRVKKNGVYTSAITSGSDALWKRGDNASISLGYNDNNSQVFNGVITSISPNRPIQFTCEDAMWKLKQVTIDKFSETKVTLKSLMVKILPDGVEYEAEDITLGKFVISKASISEVLDYLKKTFGITSYFQDGKLYSGFAYKTSSINKLSTQTEFKEFNFQKNIIDDSNLDYTRDDDVNLKVTATNIFPNNTRKSITVGDSIGEERTLFFYDVTEKELKSLATEALSKLKYEGYKGSFLTFLQPSVKHGEAVKLIDPLIPDRNGVYLVRRVITKFGSVGGRQEIFLDRKI